MTRPPLRTFVAAALALGLLVSAGCTDGEDAGSESGDDAAIATGPEGYGAEIRRTSDGVPHVHAADLAGAVFGQGWASAEDHPCDLVDQILKVTSQRAATFGAGEDDEHLESDLGWAAMGLAQRASSDWEQVEGEEREVVEAFVAGWNASFEEQGADGIRDWCTGADWMRPVTAEEVYTYGRSVLLLASGTRMLDYIVTAAPPGSEDADDGSAAPAAAAGAPGSNGWAVGAERTEDGNGMVLGNPHFPWTGELRFWEVHLSTDDGLDVYGVQLLGLPLVGIGFTDGVAWTHTVSAGRRLTAYTLDLAPGDPTSYLVDGEPVPMESRDVTVEVLADDGTLTEETRTYWSTEYGPVIDFPGVGWTDTTAASYRDANIENTNFLAQYLAMDRAQDLDELIAAQEEHQGVPLFNTIAADSSGGTWYADTSATPNLSEEAIAAYEERLDTDGLTALAADAGAVLLDGSTSRDRWVEDPDAPWPGVLPWSELPMLRRDDYVMNANDSWWVANAEEVTPGEFSPLQGPTSDRRRSNRTLENLAVLSDTSAGSVAGEGGLFSLEELADASLRNGSYTQREWLEGVVGRCETAAAAGPVTSRERADDDGAVVVPATPVDLAPACEVLGAWDGRADVDSRGAVLWRELVASVEDDQLYEVPYDPADPATTPRGLAPADAGAGADPVAVGLASAVALLDHAGVELDAPLGEVQYDGRRPDERAPVPGGPGSEGMTNVVSAGSGASTLEELPEVPEPLVEDSTLTAEGYPIRAGTSFLMAVELGPDGPEARTILTYGEVGDPSLPGYGEQMERFAQKDWKVVRFAEADVLADDGVEVQVVTG